MVRQWSAKSIPRVRISPLPLNIIWPCSSEVEHLTEDQAVGVPKAPEATMAPSSKRLRIGPFQGSDVGSWPIGVTNAGSSNWLGYQALNLAISDHTRYR